MTTFIRVTDKETGHQYDIAESALIEGVHEPLNSEEYPDLTGTQARPRPPVHAASGAESAASAPAGTPAPKAPAKQKES